ncbi:MAG: class I SAM-dependent methyltransferase [Candidatus Eisenbacteria bacterium]|uniref:Class I SAM-dependent methyltransferase n=1 Tax=Eiseniibacteriota bacterium TaxID=2212470 RepID=A0A956LWA9_UNCEI|nr:class I SAM-dependent methyltransferase [Candidatus Eisenbacteria bacterium]
MPKEQEHEPLVHQGRKLELARLDGSRRAWDAADRHVLAHLEAELGEPGQVLLVDDPCGALVVALHHLRPFHLSDSVLSQRTARHNLAANGLDVEAVRFFPSTALLPGAPPPRHPVLSARRDASAGTPSLAQRESPTSLPQRDRHATLPKCDVVLLRVPRSVALLRYYINALKPFLSPAARFIAYGMTRHMSPRLREIFATDLGPVRVSPVRQKSILFHVDVQNLEVDPKAIAPQHYRLPEDAFPIGNPQGLEIWSYPGVFSQEHLDLGTRLLLSNLPATPPEKTVVDLGCGAGVLGLVLAQRGEHIKLLLVDDSYLAVRSAEETFHRNGVAAEIRADDGLTEVDPGSVAVVVSNPPIHDGGAFVIEETVRLLQQARTALEPGGTLRVVAVHGANLGPILQTMFPRVTRVASDRRFTVWNARAH